MRRLNEADPYYRFAYSISGDTTIVTARPRYPDAPKTGRSASARHCCLMTHRPHGESMTHSLTS